MSATGILDAAYVVFYHPLNNATEWTQTEAWGGAADYDAGGKVGNALKAVVTAPGFGAEAEFVSGGSTAYVSIAALSATQFVVAYRDDAATFSGRAKVGTVSGTSVTFGATAQFLSTSTAHISAAALSSTAFVVAYQNVADSGHGNAVVGAVSGTDISFGTPLEFYGGSAGRISAAALSATVFVVAYQDNSIGGGLAKVGTVSGTSITFGTQAEFLPSGSAATSNAVAALDLTHFVVAYRDGSDSNHGTAKVGTVSGTAIAFGAETEFMSTGAASWVAAAALSGTQFAVCYADGSDSFHGTSKIGTVSGTSIAFGAEAEYNAGTSEWNSVAALGADKFAVAYADGADSGHGTAKVWQAGSTASSLTGTSGSYPTAVGATRVAAAMWAKKLTAGSSVVTVERGYEIGMAAASISLGGATAVWSAAWVATLMSTMNDGLGHLLVLDFENTAGANWNLRTSLDGNPWVDRGAQDSGSQAVAAADTAPSVAIAAGESGQWVDELVLWVGDKAAFALFSTEELANLQDLADVFGAPMDQYQEFFGAPICWQATARMPDGSPWRDSGCGPCPPVVRVPTGASDIVVTDDGRPASPRIVEG